MVHVYMTQEDIAKTDLLLEKEWHVRHDDEIWTDDDEYIATAANSRLAEIIVGLHNDQTGML